MRNFEASVEQLTRRGRERRLAASNLLLQKSLSERSESEVYESIYRALGVSAQKSPKVLA